MKTTCSSVFKNLSIYPSPPFEPGTRDELLDERVPPGVGPFAEAAFEDPPPLISSDPKSLTIVALTVDSPDCASLDSTLKNL